MKRAVAIPLVLLLALGAAYGIHSLKESSDDRAHRADELTGTAGTKQPGASGADLKAEALTLSAAEERVARPVLREQWAAARTAIEEAPASGTARTNAVRTAVLFNMAKLQLKLREHVSTEALARICNVYLKELPPLPAGD